MTDPRELLDAYAGSTVYLPDHGEFSADSLTPAAFAALRAVLELHPERKFDRWSACDGCTDGDHLVTWPCPTVTAIWTELERP